MSSEIGGGGGGGDELIVSMEFLAENVQQLEPYDFVNKLEKREWKNVDGQTDGYIGHQGGGIPEARFSTA